MKIQTTNATGKRVLLEVTGEKLYKDTYPVKLIEADGPYYCTGTHTIRKGDFVITDDDNKTIVTISN